MSYPVTLASMDKNVKRRKSRLRITSPPMPPRLTQYVQLVLSALSCQDVCLSSVLISTPHTLRLFPVRRYRPEQRVQKDQMLYTGRLPSRWDLERRQIPRWQICRPAGIFDSG